MRAISIRALRWTLVSVLVALLLVATLIGAFAFGVHSERGSAWLLARVPGLQVQSPRGALLDGDFAAARVTWQGADGTMLVIDDLAWHGLTVVRSRAPSQWLNVSLAKLSARRIALRPGATRGEAKPAGEPHDLGLPVALRIAALDVAELRIAALGDTPISGLAAQRLTLSDGGEHRVDALHAQWDRVRADASLRVATRAPFALQAQVRLASAAGTAPALPWAAQLDAHGTLAQVELAARLRATAPAGKPAPSLDAQARITPFAAWPIASLQASTRALDLSVLGSALPATALDGRADVHGEGLDKPVAVSLQLDNAAAGLWNEGKLPLRHVVTELRGRLDGGTGVELHSFDIEVGSARQAAGRIGGRGQWKREGFAFELRLADVLSAQLDARAAPLKLSGPVTVQGRGLPGDANFSGAINGDLHGEPLPVPGVKSLPPAVQVRWQGQGNGTRIELGELRAQAGEAIVVLSAQAQRQGATGWQLTGRSQWTAFDPRPWWRGREDSPWRVGPHRLNGTLAFALGVADLAQLSASTLRGHAELKLADSQLAGVPLSGSVDVQAPGGVLDGRASLDAAGNHIDAQAHWLTAGDGRGDRWQLDARAPALAKLSAALRLMPGAPATLSGALQASARVNGRWPRMSSEGRLDAQSLVADEWRVARAQARWSVGSAADSALDVQAELTQAAQGVQRVESASLRVQGTPRAHRITLDAASPARPPAWAEPLLGGAPNGATNATLRANGSLLADANAPSGWRGTIEQIALANGGQSLLAARDVRLEWQGGGGAPALSLSPARIELLGAALRVARAQWRGGAQPAIDLQAELEPLAVAPLLARLQPEFGWSGDLRLGGHIDVRSADGFSADVVFERAGGDLQVREPVAHTVQALGLTDLRVALAASQGTWHFTQALAGHTIGVLAGAQSLRVPRDALWPAADTPLEGVMELRVAELGTWGAWVPAGWRLAGSLHTSASFGGRFGAPELTGHIEGHGIGVRNALEGVEVRDGEVAIALRGERARIERFTLRSGDGSLTLAGEALLGDAPKAVLTLNAEHLRAIGRVDRKLVVSGQARLQLDRETMALEGRVSADEGFIDFSQADAPTLGDDVQVVRGERAAPQAQQQQQQRAPKKARSVTLDVQLALGEKLRIRGHGLDSGLRGTLHLTAPGGRIALNGTLRAEEGTYAAYGQKLDIERGLLQFNGPVENPRLDIIAVRPNSDVRVGVAVSGPAQGPRVRLFSEPEMAEVDKLSWLVLGRATDGLGRTETALLQRAAFALLAGERTGPDPLGHALGLDDVSMRQSEGEVKETIVTLGKQLSRRWYVGYERGLNATSGTWQLIYRIAQRFTLRAQSGLDNSMDVIWTWRWN
jgi:translocation and assembly module TamB